MTRVLLNMPTQYGGKPSGVARVAFSLIEQLIQNSEFDYVLRSPWAKAQLPQALNTPRLEVLTIERPKFMVFDVILQAFLMPALCRAHKIDLLLNLDGFGAPAGGRARVMVVHDLYFRVIPEQVRPREAFTSDLIYRLMLRSHQEIVTVSDATRQDLLHYYPAAMSRAGTIHSAATLAADRSDAGHPEIQGRYVLAVGNASPNKNFRVLAEAMGLLHESSPDVALVHVGHDPGESIATALSRSGSAVRLLRLTGIDDRRLSRLYRDAACLCVPSLSEGFCLPVLEAQDHGCPVICSDRSATPEIAGKGALTFDPRDPIALADALKTLFADPGLRDQLVRAGHENLARFSWHKAARQYEAVFRRALSGRMASVLAESA